MRLSRRHKSGFYFCLRDSSEPLIDDNGWDTGEPVQKYQEPIAMSAVISPAGGEAQIAMFGTDISYDKVILTTNTTCQIDENTVLFMEKEPEYDEDGQPLYDYIVKRVAKSKNCISYAVSRVNIS